MLAIRPPESASELSDGTTGSGSIVLATGPTLSNPVVGTQSSGDNSTKAASTAYVDALSNPDISAFVALGSATKGVRVGARFTTNPSAQTLSNQVAAFVACWVPVAGTITGVRWFQTVQGAYTANNFNGVALYSYSAGTLTRQAVSTDDGNIWKATASAWSNKNFAATYNAAAGLYFVGFLWCRSAQTTAPALYANASFNAGDVILDFTNSAKLSATVTGQTSLPTSQASSGLSTAIAGVYALLY
jgi:hypothetical protein